MLFEKLDISFEFFITIAFKKVSNSNIFTFCNVGFFIIFFIIIFWKTYSIETVVDNFTANIKKFWYFFDVKIFFYIIRILFDDIEKLRKCLFLIFNTLQIKVWFFYIESYCSNCIGYQLSKIFSRLNNIIRVFSFW